MYDTIIIGAGPGGYAASLRASELGLKVCLVEEDLIGGVCLNCGCIPTKSMANSLKLLRSVKKAKEFGIDTAECRVDLSRLHKKKNDIVSALRRSAESALKSAGAEVIRGRAQFLGQDSVTVDGKKLSAKNFVIATGSSPVPLPQVNYDSRKILSSTDILRLEDVPGSLLIIGGGYIGCEFASIYNILGSKVTIVELMDHILPGCDEEIAKRLQAHFQRRGISIITGNRVSSCALNDKVCLTLEDGRQLTADKALLCVGRRPKLGGMDTPKAGIDIDKGRIRVDGNLRTNIKNIYAIGDVTGRYNLAHVATYEGVVAADNIAQRARVADYTAIPSCIFTSPEVASCGMTEKEAIDSKEDFKVTKLPFAAVSKAHINAETEGLIKLISAKETGRIMGVHILHESASELLSNFTVAIRNGITVKSLSSVILAHPTLSESVLEVASKACR